MAADVASAGEFNCKLFTDNDNFKFCSMKQLRKHDKFFFPILALYGDRKGDFLF